jgi:UDP-N-acetylglucosamine 2-epimerase (non-hydrolysing)
MIDCLERLRTRIEAEQAHREFSLTPRRYIVATLHRPSNVDDAGELAKIWAELQRISTLAPVVLPLHPRTRQRLASSGLLDAPSAACRFHLPEPLSYVRFMSLVSEARLVITDSGGIQEETSYLGIPCLTLRTTTERPITLTDGTNELCTIESLLRRVQKVLEAAERKQTSISRWDGGTADRIVEALREMFALQREMV